MEAVPLPGLGLLTLVALAQAGLSTSVPVRVEFEAPAGCSDADAFFTGVLARASHVHRARPGETAVRLAVHLTRAGGRVHGELRVSVAGGESETRRVDGASCAEVVQVLSLTAALAIDPTADLLGPAPPEKAAAPRASARPPPPASTPATSNPAETPPAPSPASPSPPVPQSRPPEERPPAEPPPPPTPPPPPLARQPEATLVAKPRQRVPPPTGLRIGAAAVGAEVLSSSVAFGASVSGRFAARAGGLTPSATLAFIYLPGDFFEPGDDLGLRWMALAATLCPGLGLGGSLRVEPCGRATGGMLSVTDHSVSNPRIVDRWWGSAGALLRATAILGWGLGLDLEAGVDFPFITRRFITTTTVPNQVVPNQVVGVTPAVSPVVSVGLSHSL